MSLELGALSTTNKKRTTPVIAYILRKRQLRVARVPDPIKDAVAHGLNEFIQVAAKNSESESLKFETCRTSRQIPETLKPKSSW
eukprot:6981891-Pyramimonas_sp.AAC.1